MKKKQEPSNALVESMGRWTVIKPQCHPDRDFTLYHSTTNGIYEFRCSACQNIVLRIEVGRAR